MTRPPRGHFCYRRVLAGSPSFALLLGAFALVLQLILAPALMALPQAGSAAVAELSALTGEHLALCGGTADDHGGAPTHSNGDCGQCCRLGPQSAASLPPPILVAAVAPRVAPTPTAPAQAEGAAHLRYVTAQPRGPPFPA